MMDFGTTLKHLAPFAVPLLALCIPIIALIVRGIERMKRIRHLHETIRLMSEKGLPVPQELINAVATDPVRKAKEWTPALQLRSGIINISIGIGLMMLFQAMHPDTDWLWILGAIPLMIGLGFVAIWWIESRQSTS
jgi:hypothetical protein